MCDKSLEKFCFLQATKKLSCVMCDEDLFKNFFCQFAPFGYLNFSLFF